MDKKTIKFAFAVNQLNAFESENFCGADKFHVYELINNDLVYLREIVNLHKSPLDEINEGITNNGLEIIDLLKNHEINVLVSSIFGKNIQMVNNHFIPVIVTSETPAEVITAITRHIKWIKDELENRPSEFKLFTIKKGILKTSINKDHSPVMGGK